MRPFIIGVGRAGCRIASLFLNKGHSGILADSENSDLLFFPHHYKILLGEKLLDGNGAGKDLQAGREVMDAEKYHIVEKIDSVKDRMDCLFVISSMGGGTGGNADVLMEELKKSYTEPVYYAGVLPSETDQREVIVNSSETFKKMVSNCDCIFPIDNDLLREKRRKEVWYSQMNEKIFRHFSNLFGVGEYKSREELGKMVLGTTDVINTLKGVSSVGLGTYEIEKKGVSLFGKEDEKDKPEMVVHLTEKAVENTLLPFDYKESQKALVVVYGPKKYLDFVGSIPARLWVEKNIQNAEVRGGDVPSLEKRDLEVMVVLSGVKKSERLRYLYQLGKMQKNRDFYLEKLGGTLEKFRSLESKIVGIEDEFKEIFKDLKSVSEESKEDKSS